jgi:hypothetical protein
MRSPLVACALLLAMCTTRPDTSTVPIEGGAPVGAPCMQTTDCGGEELCGFPIDQGCNAQGVCVFEDFSCPTDGPVVCGCDGAPVGLACIYGAGYAPLPVVSTTPGCLPEGGGLFLEGGAD